MAKIAVCDRIHHGRTVPLVSTMAFNGAEYWCALCGALYGMMGVPRAEATAALEAEAEQLRDMSALYVRACGARVASRCRVGDTDEWVLPGDLPEADKKRNADAIANWKYRDPMTPTTSALGVG